MPYKGGVPAAEAKAMRHSNKLGAGAKARRKHLSGKAKIPVVMKEFARGTLHSGSGGIVKNRRQAVAIAMSEAGMSKK
jgi:hypothetical protein